MEPALYRKYRSRTLDEVVGQDHITSTLKKALASQRIAHAYLLSGPRGVGKTSVARILAHEVNKIPYRDDSAHLDIIEIDAASNRRIDEIRQLRERVHVAPALAKYKVYIIDEVHMLTREAFNALLKTLEEPPAHIIFILATTEAHKLPETIVSRTQRFSFKPIDTDTAVQHLANIAKSEKIKISREALQLLAEHAQGSFRDSITLLNQLSSGGQAITDQDVRDLLGLPPLNNIRQVLQNINDADPAQAFKTMERLWQSGANPAIVTAELSKLIRQEILEDQASGWPIELLRQLLLVSASSQPKDQLEIAVLESAGRAGENPRSAKAVIRSSSISAMPPIKVTPSPSRQVEVVKKSPAKTSQAVFNLEQWDSLLNEIKAKRASLYTALRLARPSLEGDTLTLAFQFPLHQRKLSESAHRRLVEDLLAAKTGGQLKVIGIVDKSFKPSRVSKARSRDNQVNDSESLQTISSIFGPAEVLES